MQKEGFLSEDGATFTSIIETEDKTGNDNNDGEIQSTGNSVDDVLNKIKIDELPENQRDTVSQLVSLVKSLNEKIDTSSKDSKIIEVLQALQEQIKNANTKEVVTENVRKKLSDQMKFEDEEKDFYAPHLKMLANAIDSILDKFDGVDKRFEDNKKGEFVRNVQSFIKTNRIPEPVIKKMDEIARGFGPGAYNDLERLYKYAKAELGIKESPSRTTEATRKNVFEFGGKKKTEKNVEQKPAKTMMEAWDQAENSLADAAED